MSASKVAQTGSSYESQNSLVRQAESRLWSYWFIDGLPNLVIGLGVLFFAGGLAALESNSHLATAVGIIAFVPYFVILVRLKQVVEWLKSRITYPRTGYVSTPDTRTNTGMPVSLPTLFLENEHAPITAFELERRNRSQIWRIWLVAGIAGGAILITHSSWSYLAAGVILGIGLWLGARKVDKMAWIGAMGFPIAGAYLYTLPNALPVQRNMRLSVFLAIPAFLLVVQGGITLVRYLRRNPVAHS